MKTIFSVAFIVVVIPMIAAICKGGSPQSPSANQRASSEAQAANTQKEEAEITASLAKLSEEDRPLAEAQKFCPVMATSRLGSMGPPIKVMIKHQPVFLCCKGCRTKALANPDKTLATVAAVQIKSSLAKLSEEDRPLAEAQKFCPIMATSRLGSMGPPVKVVIKDQPVFLCCKGCQTKALANPDKTLATVAELLKANKKVESTKK